MQITLTNIATGVADLTDIINGEQDPTVSSPTDVAAGTVVKAVYAELWLMGDGQQPATVTTCIIKVPNGGSGPSTGEMTNLNAYNSKRNILEMHQGLIGDANTNPSPFYRGWIKIPKGKQRFGLGDKLVLAVKSISEGTQMCGLFIFKAYN